MKAQHHPYGPLTRFECARQNDINYGGHVLDKNRIVDFLPLLSLAIKNEHVVSAERYISAVGLAMFVYDYTLTFGDEMQYIWRRPITGIKILYLILRYGVAIAELVYFQALSGLTAHLSHNLLGNYCCL